MQLSRKVARSYTIVKNGFVLALMPYLCRGLSVFFPAYIHAYPHFLLHTFLIFFNFNFWLSSMSSRETNNCEQQFLLVLTFFLVYSPLTTFLLVRWHFLFNFELQIKLILLKIDAYVSWSNSYVVLPPSDFVWRLTLWHIK